MGWEKEKGGKGDRIKGTGTFSQCPRGKRFIEGAQPPGHVAGQARHVLYLPFPFPLEHEIVPVPFSPAIHRRASPRSQVALGNAPCSPRNSISRKSIRHPERSPAGRDEVEGPDSFSFPHRQGSSPCSLIETSPRSQVALGNASCSPRSFTSRKSIRHPEQVELVSTLSKDL
jgi:hypothetical protein